MKKRTITPSVLGRMRAAVRRVVGGVNRGATSGYDSARISAELRTIVERRTAYER
jgi:hypothetical protein